MRLWQVYFFSHQMWRLSERLHSRFADAVHSKIVMWSGKLGQRVKMYPPPKNGHKDGKERWSCLFDHFAARLR